MRAERAHGEAECGRHEQGPRSDRQEGEDRGDDPVPDERPRDEDAEAGEDGGEAGLRQRSVLDSEAGREPADQRSEVAARYYREDGQPGRRPEPDRHQGHGEPPEREPPRVLVDHESTCTV